MYQKKGKIMDEYTKAEYGYYWDQEDLELVKEDILYAEHMIDSEKTREIFLNLTRRLRELELQMDGLLKHLHIKR